MSESRNPIVPFDAEHLVRRLSRAADHLGIGGLQSPEVEHLVGVVTRCSAFLGDVYTDETLRAILADDPRRLARLVASPWFRLPVSGDLPTMLTRLRRLPDDVRGVGDKALFDHAIGGLSQIRGVALDDLGPRAYGLAAEVLEMLADDARLREHFLILQSGGALRIEDEISFLRRCADRFDVYSQLLRFAGEDDPDDADDTDDAAPSSEADDAPRRLLVAARNAPVVNAPALRAPRDLMPAPPPRRRTPAHGEPGAPGAAGAAGIAGAAARLFPGEHLGREQLLSAYERLLLFAALDLERLRRDLEQVVVDQEEAIATLIDDFALFAVGTQHLARPASYFLVGPTGVGKNHMVETLAARLSRQWGEKVPFLTIEGPNYTYSSDINELRGATRGFIRSDEPGLLTQFHAEAAKAPLSILLVDEVEKSHPQLIRFFLSILDRGTTTDAHGNELSFAGTLIFFTSNIGYEEGAEAPPIGFAGERESEAAYRSGLSRSLRKALPPEFINRVRMVRFRHLPRASAERILDLEFERIAARYRDLHGIELALSPAGREALLDQGYSHEYGARHLAAVLQRTCNVDVGKMLRRDETGAARDPAALLARLRAARASEDELDLAELDREIFEQARARVPYRRIVVDADVTGAIVYRREDGA